MFYNTFGIVSIKTYNFESMKIEEAILYYLASQNRRTSEIIIKLAFILPSEKEEDEVNREMRTEQIAEMINHQRLHIRKDRQPITSNQVYAVICRYPNMFTKAEGRIMLMI